MATTGVLVKYGDYVMEPAPLVSYSREVFRTANNEEIIGGTYSISLEGTLWPPGRDATGPDGPVPLFKAKDDLLQAFGTDYKKFHVEFSGDGPDCSGQVACGHPYVASLSVDSPDNWARRGNYQIELIFGISSLTGTADFIGGSGITTTGYLQSLEVDYNIEYLRQPYTYAGNYFGPVIQVSRNINAQGLPIGIGDANLPPTCEDSQGLEQGGGFYQAAKYVSGLVLTDGNYLNTGEIDITDNTFKIPAGAKPVSYLTSRSISSNKRSNTITLNDEFMLLFKGDPFATTTGVGIGAIVDDPVIDTFNIDANQAIENGVHTISIGGDVQGIKGFRVASGILIEQEGGIC